jgi:integrase/recombinase XerD
MGHNTSPNNTADSVLPQYDDFLLSLTINNYTESTVKNYERDLEALAQFLVTRGLSFHDLSKQTIDQYKAELIAGQRATLKEQKPSSALDAKSINRMLTTLRSFLAFLIDRDEDVPLIPQQIKLLKKEKRITHVPDLPEILTFVESPEHLESNEFIGLRNRTIMEIMLASGMRISEVLSLQNDNVEDSGKMYVTGKGHKQRFVYLTPRARGLLYRYRGERREVIRSALPSPYQSDEYVDKFTYLFVTKKTFDGLADAIKEHNQLPDYVFASHISANHLQAKFKEYRLQLGFSTPISPHTLRHAFATYLAESGASPAAIQILLGHESLETTTTYVNASERFAEETHTDYHPVKK